MRLAVAGLGVAALVIVGRVAAQSAATQWQNSTCAGDASPAGTPCTIPHGSDPAGNDLTPTQWLFGRDLGTKLTQPAGMVALAAAASNGGWATVRARAGNALPAATTKASPVARPRAATGDAAEVQPAWGQSLTPQQFLIEEWRHSEIGVADSVYHDALMRITATFDSAQRARINDADRTSILRRLDALLDANSYTWTMFRFEIRRRADSALAALKATD
jgi:hypothetical protein